MPVRQYGTVTASGSQSDLTVIARYLLPLMLRNVASDGFVFADPADPNRFSSPGCIIASPSFERNLASVNQNYVYNWTRDAAVTAVEIALAGLPVSAGDGSGPLQDYVAFAATCQANAPTLARAAYTIDGRPRDWTDQNDGPALQTLAILSAYDQLDAASRTAAVGVATRNLTFLLAEYQHPSFNLWEETYGQSFFTRSVQLRCLLAVRDNSVGLAVPAGIQLAVDWLRNALNDHWNGEIYLSLLDPRDPRGHYDPNIDIVMACVYGAVDPTDPKLLATAGRIRRQWADPAEPTAYPINQADDAAGRGPLLGRYPGDVYDGDVSADDGPGHPWALCTANFAELYYRLASAVDVAGPVPYDAQTADFLGQVGIDKGSPAAEAARLLRDAGDRMLQAVLFHSDHLELSEQFDETTGYEKSVRNLTWSYAAFLSAVRARTGSRAG